MLITILCCLAKYLTTILFCASAFIFNCFSIYDLFLYGNRCIETKVFSHHGFLFYGEQISTYTFLAFAKLMGCLLGKGFLVSNRSIRENSKRNSFSFVWRCYGTIQHSCNAFSFAVFNCYAASDLMASFLVL